MKNSNFNLKEGCKNEWRMTAKWPAAGKFSIKIWAVIPMFLVLYLLFGGFVPLIGDFLNVLIALFVLSKILKKDVAQMWTWLTCRFGVKHKTSNESWKVFSLIVCLSMLPAVVPSDAQAAFEIVIPPSAKAVDPFDQSGELYLEGGFGREVKLVDLLKQILPSPYHAEFFNSEIMDLKVNWYAESRVFLNTVLADISRRYGVLFTWHKSAGLLSVSFDIAQCRIALAENENERRSYAERIGTAPQALPEFVRKIIDARSQMEIIC